MSSRYGRIENERRARRMRASAATTPNVTSPMVLLQECYVGHPWAQTVIPLLCAKTNGKTAQRCLRTVLELIPEPKAYLDVHPATLTLACQPAGFQIQRAQFINACAAEVCNNGWPRSWYEATLLPGYGAYAADSWQMFVLRILTEPASGDHVLLGYWDWARAFNAKCWKGV